MNTWIGSKRDENIPVDMEAINNRGRVMERQGIINQCNHNSHTYQIHTEVSRFNVVIKMPSLYSALAPGKNPQRQELKLLRVVRLRSV